MTTETTEQVSVNPNNTAFVSAWKKAAGPQKQLTLQTKSEAFTKFCLEEGWGLKEMKTFQQLLEATKYAVPTTDGCAPLALLGETLSLAEHLEVHPICLISFAKSVVGMSQWTMDALEKTREHLAASEGEQDDIPPGAVSTAEEVLGKAEYNYEGIKEHTAAQSDDDTEVSDGGKRKRRLFPDEATQYE